MTTEPGQVYFIDLGMAAKSRPMLVVSRRDEDAPRALALCAPVTTSSRGSNYEVEIGKLKFLRERSYVNVQGLQAIQYHEMKSMIGKVPEDVLSRVRETLAWMFEISDTK